MPKVRGEEVEILGPKPSDWNGLGSNVAQPALLVRYPDGEVGAVPEDSVDMDQSDG